MTRKRQQVGSDMFQIGETSGRTPHSNKQKEEQNQKKKKKRRSWGRRRKRDLRFFKKKVPWNRVQELTGTQVGGKAERKNQQDNDRKKEKKRKNEQENKQKESKKRESIRTERKRKGRKIAISLVVLPGFFYEWPLGFSLGLDYFLNFLFTFLYLHQSEHSEILIVCSQCFDIFKVTDMITSKREHLERGESL